MAERLVADRERREPIVRIEFIMQDRPPFQVGAVIFKPSPMTQEDSLLEALRARSITAFKTLVIDYAEDMTIFAYLLLNDNQKANEIVDRLLLHLYNNGFANATVPLHSYLYQELKKECKAHMWQARIMNART